MSEDFSYASYEYGTVSITKYNGEGGDVVISDTIDGKTVTSISNSAFAFCSSLTSITIPDCVTSIGENSFRGCSNLTSITPSEGTIRIGKYAFADCSSLTLILIPDSVTSIGYSTFGNCSDLMLIKVSESNNNYCSDDGVLFDKNKKTLIRYPEGKQNTEYNIPKNVTSIEGNAFEGCSGLTLITIPEGVTSIGYEAFGGCSGLTSITMPKGVTSIGGEAFSGCSGLTSITIAESVTSIGNAAFSGCTGLTSIIIPEGVTNIGGSAFSYCSGLTSIAIPEGVTSINDNAFYNCSALTSITIPKGMTCIGEYTFMFCRNLKSITISDNVANIGRGAFCDCFNLKDVYYAGTKAEWEKINIDSSNTCLTNATIHYNSTSPDYDEQAVGNVHFLISYAPETGKVRFDESSTHIGLDYTLSDIIDKELAASLVDKYVLAKINSDSLTVTDLKPVDSKIGTISAIDKTASTITIDGEVYPLSKDNSVLTMFADQQIGKKVMFHICAKIVIALNSVETKTEKLESWDYTNQELTIDGKAYPTNFLTDISFLEPV